MTDITPIKLAVADDIRAGSLAKNLTENENGSLSGKIKIGYKSYTVSVSDTGEVNVNRKLGFFGRIFIRNSHTATAIRLENKIAELLKTNEYAMVRNANTQLKNIISNSGGKKDIEVANYGLKDNRIVLVSSGINVDAAQKNKNVDRVSFNTIDTYNAMIGIKGANLTSDKYEKTMNAIVSGIKIKDADDDGYDKAQVKKWNEFLARPENMAKINIPKKLYNYMHQDPNAVDGNTKTTGWKAAFRKNPDEALKQFVLKNIPYGHGRLSDDETQFLAGKLKEFVEIFNSEGTSEERHNSLQSFSKSGNWKLSGSEKTPHDLRELFENVLVYSTFRQTSKLGINFFREQKVPVMFQFSDNKGNSLEGEGNAKIIGESFWKNSESSDHGGSSITNSELRHINRILVQENLDLTHSSEAGIYLAAGGHEDKP
ncbi:MAG: hypothetical protein II922_00080 [Succinimonas sp.]|nr:hypothetical protein [Succinimonas sp.]